MYFGLSEEQQFFQESIDKFLEDTVTVDALRSYRTGEDNNLVDEVFNGLNELGLSGLIIPEEYGGLGLDSLFAVSVSESLGKGVAPYPFTGSFLIAPFLINKLGSDSQKQKYLPSIATGEYRFAVALTEMTGRRIEKGIQNSNQKLSGQSLFVMDDINSTHYLILDSDGALLIIEAEESGLEKVELTTVDITSFMSELLLDEVKAETLGSGSGNIEALKQAINLGRVAIAAETLGASQCMLNRSVDY
ncbi:MAG: acyl-CoA dehydrogenase family protein, partial [Gammaproteobacteria bacterium]